MNRRGRLGHIYSSGLTLTPLETFARHSAPPPKVQKDNTIHAANRWNSAFRVFCYFSVRWLSRQSQNTTYRHRWAPTDIIKKFQNKPSQMGVYHLLPGRKKKEGGRQLLSVKTHNYQQPLTTYSNRARNPEFAS